MNVSRAAAADRRNPPKEIVEHIAPVRQHVEDDTAAIGLAVVPGRALRGLQVAFEHPVAELAAHRQNAAEKAGSCQHAQLAQPRQEQLVLDHAMFYPAGLGESRHAQRLLQGLRDGLLAIDVLAGANRALQQLNPQLCRAGVEEYRVIGVGQRRFQVRRVARDIVAAGDFGELVGIAAHQDGVRHGPIAVGQGHATGRPQRRDRAHQVLVVTHPPGHAVHDDAESLDCHAPPEL